MGNLVVIGCGRSGTTFISKHLNLGHEELSKNGIVAWQSTVEINYIYSLKSDDFVIHQVRHPIATISSCHTINKEKSWDLIKKNIPSINKSDSLLLKCMKYWYYWNLIAEKKALATYRVEKIQSKQPKNINARKDWLKYKKISWADLQAEDSELTHKIKSLAVKYGYNI